MERFTLVGAMVLNLAGCGTTFHGVGTVSAEVKQDEVAAAVRMRQQELGLEGRVKDNGLKSEKVVATETSGFGVPMGFATPRSW